MARPCFPSSLLHPFSSVLFVVDSFSLFFRVRRPSHPAPSDPGARAMPHPHLAAFYCVNCSLLPRSRPSSALPFPFLLVLSGGLAILFLLSPLVSDSLLILPPAVHPGHIPSPLPALLPFSPPPTKFCTSEKSPSGGRGSAPPVSLLRGPPVIFAGRRPNDMNP